MTKHRILALALAGALAVPQVGLAAEDSTGMRYDSASEGLYGSLRTIYRSKAGNKDNNNGVIEADASRFGFRGTADMGGGLTGTYHYETTIGGHNGEDPGKVRLNYVGVKGGFGEVRIGGTPNNVYSGAYSYVDGSISGGGNYYPGLGSRLTDAFTYNTPELNGFQGFAYMQFNGGSDTRATVGLDVNRDGDTTDSATITESVPDAQRAAFITAVNAIPGFTAANGGANEVVITAAEADAGGVGENQQLDRWGIGGTYSIRGFKVGGGYEVMPEALAKEPTRDDKTAWHLAGQYGQDNWTVAAVYGQQNYSDGHNAISRGNVARVCGAANLPKCEDQTAFGLLGKVTVGKVGIIAEHNTLSDVEGFDGLDREWTSVGAEYKFTAQTKVYGAYIARDDDTDATVTDSVVIGMRVDF